MSQTSDNVAKMCSAALSSPVHRHEFNGCASNMDDWEPNHQNCCGALEKGVGVKCGIVIAQSKSCVLYTGSAHARRVAPETCGT